MRRCGQCKASPTGDHVHGVHANGQHRDDTSGPMHTTASPQNKRERQTLPQARFTPQTTLPRMPHASLAGRLRASYSGCCRRFAQPIAAAHRACAIARTDRRRVRSRVFSPSRECPREAGKPRAHVFRNALESNFHQRDTRSLRLTHSFLKFTSCKGLHLINFEFAGRYPLLMPRKGHPLFGG